ncbi:MULTISPECIES: hypothetical protein [Ignatzschineria]|uniref:Uncharacterized protein n=1 Tax=Ignatzschineria cameli TaxID=2182793 RepID=A0A2U2AQD1_9GAMM|nr:MULTISPECIES: hypothetical protein [Ignatzschineria]MDM1545535.1 hypothetical protein [Ignatzschineria indica]PWD85823.1 hypothetical protein DC077_07260 [Ignatzschineria cameli]PWD89451.1 hypothetical protein DC079_06885 [Ignatzschineria cameli]PWD90923.1 hypothetical protein DC081_06595 [Ignatzschineria cameli]PWD91711.1 hypothetical protein DC078_06880 [Ignatzschineria cameli]
MSRKDLNQARAVLEAWARWSLDSNGFPSESPLARIGEMRSEADGSRLPDGIEQDQLAQDATFVFLAMRNDPNNKMSLKHRKVLQEFYLERKEGESVGSICQRLDKFSPKEYTAALNEFAHKLDMFYLLKDITSLEKKMGRKRA